MVAYLIQIPYRTFKVSSGSGEMFNPNKQDYLRRENLLSTPLSSQGAGKDSVKCIHEPTVFLFFYFFATVSPMRERKAECVENKLLRNMDWMT